MVKVLDTPSKTLLVSKEDFLASQNVQSAFSPRPDSEPKGNLLKLELTELTPAIFKRKDTKE